MIARWTNPIVRRAKATLLAALGRRATGDTYVRTEPSPQTALDLFQGEWETALPAPLDAYRAGRLPLCDDDRLRWAIGELGGVAGKTVLELGPLEGAHTYALERAGAASVTAIEANPRAFLRCLVFKEVTGLTRVRFLCGDFLAFLRPQDGQRQFDVGVASGVLYHMADPVELLARLGATCRSAYIWTHYYDAARVAANRRLDGRFRGSEAAATAGFRHTRWRQVYLASGYRAGFCGGPAASSAWLTRDDILGALRHFGFDDIRVGFEEPDHENGPSFAIVASRQG